METVFSNPVKYILNNEDLSIDVNSLLGKNISIEHIGYKCLNCNQNKEIYRQGFCKKCFFESPAVGDWIMKPELSTAHLGIPDRDLQYETSVQLQPHIVYLAASSEIKVGVTRKSQVPTRWIDQGAHQALPILEVPNRYLAGITEVALKQLITDKTNWRKMLTNSICPPDDILLTKNRILPHVPSETQPYIIDYHPIDISYPVLSYPSKVNSLSLTKLKSSSGTLSGIKGQYLIFSNGNVFNVRSHEGFIINLSISN